MNQEVIEYLHMKQKFVTIVLSSLVVGIVGYATMVIGDGWIDASFGAAIMAVGMLYMSIGFAMHSDGWCRMVWRRYEQPSYPPLVDWKDKLEREDAFSEVPGNK